MQLAWISFYEPSILQFLSVKLSCALIEVAQSLYVLLQKYHVIFAVNIFWTLQLHIFKWWIFFTFFWISFTFSWDNCFAVLHSSLKLACSYRAMQTIHHVCLLIFWRDTEKETGHICLSLPWNWISKGQKDFYPLQWVPVFINQSPMWYSEAWILLKLQWWGLKACYNCSCQWVEVIILDSVFSLLFVVIGQGTICNFHVCLDTDYNFIETSAAKAAVFTHLCHMWERPLQKVISCVG